MATQVQTNGDGKMEAVEHLSYWPIQATIWRSIRPNEAGMAITSFLVTIEKSYQKKDANGNFNGEYESTQFIDEKFAPLASKALNDAHSRIQAHKLQRQAQRVTQASSLAPDSTAGLTDQEPIMPEPQRPATPKKAVSGKK